MTRPFSAVQQNRAWAEWVAAKDGTKLAAREAAAEARIDEAAIRRANFQREQNELQRQQDELERQRRENTNFYILYAASGIHIALNLLNGRGNPEPGDGLTQGAGVFRDASAILRRAGSDPGWQGAAAQSYDARNTEQQARTNQMASLDTQLAGLLQTQAVEVQLLRVYMGLNSMTLVAGYMAAKIALAEANPAWCYTIQIAFATACLSLDGWLHDQQKLRAQTTGAEIEKLAANYSQIADTAVASRPLH
jgi:hypothetical protein